MERKLVLRPKLQGQFRIDLEHIPEDRPAKLHAALDDAGSIGADDPLACLGDEVGGSFGCGRGERELVEPQADLGIGATGEAVQGTEVRYVREGKRRQGLKALEKHD